MLVSSVISLFISFIGLCISFYNYMEIRKRNIIDLMPFFDIRINNIYIDVDKKANKIYFSIPIVNLGNRLALNIKTTEIEENIKIIYSLAAEKEVSYITFFEYMGDILEKEKKFIVTITFEDLSNQIYSQKIKLNYKISKNYNNNPNVPRVKFYYLKNGEFYSDSFNIPIEEIVYLHHIDKEIEKPEKKK